MPSRRTSPIDLAKKNIQNSSQRAKSPSPAPSPIPRNLPEDAVGLRKECLLLSEENDQLKRCLRLMRDNSALETATLLSAIVSFCDGKFRRRFADQLDGMYGSRSMQHRSENNAALGIYSGTSQTSDNSALMTTATESPYNPTVDVFRSDHDQEEGANKVPKHTHYEEPVRDTGNPPRVGSGSRPHLPDNNSKPDSRPGSATKSPSRPPTPVSEQASPAAMPSDVLSASPEDMGIEDERPVRDLPEETKKQSRRTPPPPEQNSRPVEEDPYSSPDSYHLRSHLNTKTPAVTDLEYDALYLRSLALAAGYRALAKGLNPEVTVTHAGYPVDLDNLRRTIANIPPSTMYRKVGRRGPDPCRVKEATGSIRECKPWVHSCVPWHQTRIKPFSREGFREDECTCPKNNPFSKRKNPKFWMSIDYEADRRTMASPLNCEGHIPNVKIHHNKLMHYSSCPQSKRNKGGRGGGHGGKGHHHGGGGGGGGRGGRGGFGRWGGGSSTQHGGAAGYQQGSPGAHRHGRDDEKDGECKACLGRGKQRSDTVPPCHDETCPDREMDEESQGYDFDTVVAPVVDQAKANMTQILPSKSKSNPDEITAYTLQHTHKEYATQRDGTTTVATDTYKKSYNWEDAEEDGETKKKTGQSMKIADMEQMLQAKQKLDTHVQEVIEEIKNDMISTDDEVQQPTPIPSKEDEANTNAQNNYPREKKEESKSSASTSKSAKKPEASKEDEANTNAQNNYPREKKEEAKSSASTSKSAKKPEAHAGTMSRSEEKTSESRERVHWDPKTDFNTHPSQHLIHVTKDVHPRKLSLSVDSDDQTIKKALEQERLSMIDLRQSSTSGKTRDKTNNYLTRSSDSCLTTSSDEGSLKVSRDIDWANHCKDSSAFKMVIPRGNGEALAPVEEVKSFEESFEQQPPTFKPVKITVIDTESSSNNQQSLPDEALLLPGQTWVKDNMSGTVGVTRLSNSPFRPLHLPTDSPSTSPLLAPEDLFSGQLKAKGSSISIFDNCEQLIAKSSSISILDNSEQLNAKSSSVSVFENCDPEFSLFTDSEDKKLVTMSRSRSKASLKEAELTFFGDFKDNEAVPLQRNWSNCVADTYDADMSLFDDLGEEEVMRLERDWMAGTGSPGLNSIVPCMSSQIRALSTVCQKLWDKNLLGEVAFQLERRILDYVFAKSLPDWALDRQQRAATKRFYGYTVNNIGGMITREAMAGEHYSKGTERMLRERLRTVLDILTPMGYDLMDHGSFSQDTINKYGLLSRPPVTNNTGSSCEVGIPGMEVADVQTFIFDETESEEERHNLLLLFDCLRMLAIEDGRPLFVW